MDDEQRGPGRPSLFRPEYVEQARKLCLLGATDRELADFFGANPSEDDWYRECLRMIREDRRGVIAGQKKAKAAAKRRRRESSPSRRIVESMRARMWAALKGRSDGALFSRLGYTAEELVGHLQRRFVAGMSWENYGKWHIDHVQPCASFDQSDPAQFQACWALSNLQPLWAADNIRKGAKHVAP